MNSIYKSLVVFSLGLLLAACNSSSSSDDDQGGNSGGATVIPGSVKDVGATLCGLTSNGNYQNPPQFSDGEDVLAIQVIDSNLVNVTTASGPKLVKLQGLGDTNGLH